MGPDYIQANCRQRRQKFFQQTARLHQEFVNYKYETDQLF